MALAPRKLGNIEDNGTAGLLPGGDESDWRSLLSKLYQRHDPEKLPELEQILEKHRGGEAALYDALRSQYGVNVPAPLLREEDDDFEEGRRLRPPPAPVPQVIEVGSLNFEAEDDDYR